ncbi:MAG: hypothetical protein K940chlam2_00309 [Chlamydiae bacterium]|nr:hypothetical protein [Chlamydiota bacterium]
MAREVSNLGLDAYNRYARDQDTLDKTLLKEARSIPLQTQVDVTQPSYKSEFEMLFSLGAERTPRALFSPPEHFEEGSIKLFTYHISKVIGGPERQESNIERLTAFPVAGEEKKSEKETLLKSLNTFLDIEKQKVDIYSFLGQFKKG